MGRVRSTRWMKTWGVCALDTVDANVLDVVGACVLDAVDASHGGRGACALDTVDEAVERVRSTRWMKTWICEDYVTRWVKGAELSWRSMVIQPGEAQRRDCRGTG